MKPELRYRGYKDDWTRCSLKDYLIEHKGGAPLQPKDFTDEADFEVIPKKSIIANGWLNMNKISPTYCTKDFFEKYPRSVINNEYLVTTLRDLVPSGPTIGYIVKFDSNSSYLLAQGVYGFKIKSNELAPDFLIQLSNTSKYRKMMNKLMVGSTQVHIRNEDFFSMPIELPQYEEQQKIADFLFALDKKISLLKEKHALLEQYKKGVMQKLFSQEIRFKDENGNIFPDWKTERIDYFVERASEPVEVQPDKTYREIGVRSHGKGIFHKKEIKGHELGNKRVFWVHPDAFVVNIVFAWEHAVAKTSLEETGFIASHRFPMFIPRQSRVDLRFFTIYFLSQKGKHLLGLASPGGAGRNKTLGQNNFAELKLKFPSLEEQKKISDFYEVLDAKVKLVKKQIVLTQTFKKGLLQQMFV